MTSLPDTDILRILRAADDHGDLPTAPVVALLCRDLLATRQVARAGLASAEETNRELARLIATIRGETSHG